MKHCYIIFLFLLFQFTVLAYNPFWVRKDKRLIYKVVQLNRSDPKSVEHFFRKSDNEKSRKCNLGFGWKKQAFSASGGYISISATFYYFKDSIVSYEIYPDIPHDPDLNDQYMKWYCDSFSNEIVDNIWWYSDTVGHPTFEVLPFQYNWQAILKPLSDYHGPLKPEDVSSNVLEYMSPDAYMLYEGQSLSHLNDYYKIQDTLTNNLTVLLMYAINPVVRITAIIYYLNHKSSFTLNPLLDAWVEKNVEENILIGTKRGCLVFEEPFKTVLERCTNYRK